jgi:hypothetical protein
VNVGSGCDDLRIRDVLARGNSRTCISTPTGLLRLSVDGVEAVDCNTLASEAVVQINTGCNQAVVRNVRARDTRVGAARTTGRPVNFVGSTDKVHYDAIYSENLATGGVGLGAGMTNVTAGAVLTW